MGTRVREKVIEQIEVQRRGGICVKYPVSCLIFDLISNVLDVFHRRIVILDLTYGEGRFYKAFGVFKPYIIAIDIRKLNWHVVPDEFYLTAAWRWKHVVNHKKVDLVVVDPPWMEWRRGSEGRYHYSVYNIVGSPLSILNAGFEAAIHYNAYILIHYKERVTHEKFDLLNEIWFRGRSRLANLSRPSWFGILKLRRGDYERVPI